MQIEYTFMNPRPEGDHEEHAALKLRYRDIADAWLEIESPATHPSEAVLAPPRFSLLWLAACAAIMLLAGILIDRLLTRTF